jgi:methylmalonyl-CoA/ethylmalonyl-CoA epimerase
MRKIEHIGIAVSDIEESNKIFTKIFGKENYKEERVESEGVVTSFFQVGENKIELVAATNEDSPIAKFLSKNREGMHHIAFDVENIEAEMERLKNEGIRILNDKPKKGADNKLICFLHPKDTNGVLIELCQEIAE